MQLFVSYARDDADTVHRLVARLEEAGHTTWLDTDDIVGSEAWRASIVEGLRTADAVVLVLSPRSMASTYVEREVVLAAELHRPVVPVVIAATGLTDSVRFELAGRQQVSFVDRPFDDGVVDLLAALTGLATAPTPPEAPPPADPRPAAPTAPARSQRRPLVTGIAVAAVALVLVAIAAIARRGGDDRGDTTVADASVTATDRADDAATPATAGSTGAATIAVGADVWFAGFRITVATATHDPTAMTVTIALRATSDQYGPADPGTLFDGDTVLEWSSGSAVGACGCSTRLPRGAATPVTAGFLVDASYDARSAVLVFGGPTQHQVRVPLDGAAPTGDGPIDHAVSGTVDDGDGTMFRVERVRVVPAACTGLADGVTLEPTPAGTWSVLVIGTVRHTGTAAVNFGVATLTGPDGVTVGSSTLAGPVYALAPEVPTGDVGICFAVPGPVRGTYRFRAAAHDISPAQGGLDLAL